MLGRLVMLNRHYSSIRGGVRSYASKAKNQLRCEAHMNELPVPCGPWGPWYEARQSFYTKWLIFGVVWFAITLGVVFQSGYINFTYFFPPDKPGPPSDAAEEECEEV